MPLEFLPEDTLFSHTVEAQLTALSVLVDKQVREAEAAKQSAAVTALIARAGVTTRRQRRRYRTHVALGQAIFMVAFYLMFNDRLNAFPVVVKFILAFFILAIWAAIDTHWSSSPSRGEMDALIQQGGIRAVSPLLDALRMNDCRATNVCSKCAYDIAAVAESIRC